MISLALQCAALALVLIAAGGFYLLVKGCYVLRRQARTGFRDDTAILLKSPQIPMVSVIAVAYDASPASLAYVRRLLDLHFSNHEVVVVLDGPSDADFEKYVAEYRLIATSRGTWESLDPLRLVIVRTERAGAAAAYNSGVSSSAGSIIAVFDRDSHFVPEALLRLIPPMLRHPDDVTAVCGLEPELVLGGLVKAFAALESLRLWLARCAAFSAWNMLLPVPGCCLLIRRAAILEAGGFPAARGSLPGFAGPLELILHLHGKARTGGAPFRMALVVEPVSVLPAPASRGELRRHILNDQRVLRAAFRQRKSIAGGIGAIGWGLPALLCSRLIRPLLETALYAATAAAIAAKLVSSQIALVVLLCTVVTGILLSMSAVVLRELSEYRGSSPRRLVGLFFAAIPENLGYRQVRNFWLLRGFWMGQS